MNVSFSCRGGRVETVRIVLLGTQSRISHSLYTVSRRGALGRQTYWDRAGGLWQQRVPIHLSLERRDIDTLLEKQLTSFCLDIIKFVDRCKVYFSSATVYN
jgi:hypothetical protein